MKVSPIQIVGASAILALIVLGLYFYQTSPKVTSAPPKPVTVEVEQSNPAPTTDTAAQPEAEQVDARSAGHRSQDRLTGTHQQPTELHLEHTRGKLRRATA